MLRNAVAIMLACSALVSCANLDREYRLRYWEKCRIASEQALLKHHTRQAVAMGAEAVKQARGFGESDFRLGVSLCDFGNALKAAGREPESEDAYRQAEKVLQAAGKTAAQAVTASEKAGRKVEQSTNEVLCRLVKEDLANTLSRLADLYCRQKRNQDAINCFERAAAIYQSVLAGNQLCVDDAPLGQEFVQCLTGLARASEASKKYEIADSAYKRALEVAAASNCPEYRLREIRDSYLALLQQQGRTREADQLLADGVYAKCSSDGMQALKKQNYAEAENLFRKASIAAAQSIFSKRRLMRSFSNLHTALAQQNKAQDMEENFARAKAFMKAQAFNYSQASINAQASINGHAFSFDNDFDQMLAIQAVHYMHSGRASQAVALLDQQLQDRLKHYQPSSMEVCETLVLKGEAELLSNNLQAAEASAAGAYKIILAHYMSDRRAVHALNDTADLMAKLHHFEQAEVLKKQIVENNLRFLDPDDLRVVGNQASLFMLYFQFNKHDAAMKVVNDTVAILKKGNSSQKPKSMPYLVLMQSCALARQWYDVAEPITEIGQSILRKESGGEPMDAMNQTNWTRDVAKMEKHFGRKI
jgi:hypothetical protein